LAFARVSHGVQSIYTVPLSGGAEQRLISGSTYNWGLAWTPQGRDIVFANAGWLPRTLGSGRYPFAGVSQNDCSSVKEESNL